MGDTLMALTDRLEQWFPKWAMKRAQARSLKRYYDAADNGQYWRNVSQGGNQSADTVVTQANMQLRAIARNLDENSDLAAGVLDTLVKKVIGTELKLIPGVMTKGGKPSEKLSKDIERLWWDFSQAPETTRELSMPEVQRLVCRTWLRDGEMLVHHVRGTNRISARTQVAYAMELLEADYLPFHQQAASSNLKKQPNLVNGVEKNQWGAPVAYHVYKDHPGAMTYQLDNTTETKRVLARDMVHLKYVKRLRQTRGIPILTTVLRRLEDIRDYEESERIAARINASFAAAITKSTEFAQVSTDTSGKRSMEMAAGQIFDDLLPGESITPIGTERPNPELINFRNGQLRAVAAGTLTNYSAISQNYDGSYSAMRQELQDSKVNYDVLRTQFINDFLTPIYREFIGVAVAQGLIRIPSNVDEMTLMSPQWSTPGTPWIDPLKEMQADLAGVEAGITSKAHIQRARGIDPVKMNTEIEKEQAENPVPRETPNTPIGSQDEPDEEAA
jgi:lambda family phage portal protein